MRLSRYLDPREEGQELAVCWSQICIAASAMKAMLTTVLRTVKIPCRQNLAVAHHRCWERAREVNHITAGICLLMNYQLLDAGTGWPFMFPPMWQPTEVKAIYTTQARQKCSVLQHFTKATEYSAANSGMCIQVGRRCWANPCGKVRVRCRCRIGHSEMQC